MKNHPDQPERSHSIIPAEGLYRGKYASMYASLNFLGQIAQLVQDNSQTLNDDVPQFGELEEERKQLLQNIKDLERLRKKPPLILIEHEGCFTNLAMRRTLLKILGGIENASRYLQVITLSPKRFEFPEPEEGVLYIFGGSLSDTYDPFGKEFTRRLSLPLLQKVMDGCRSRILGVCFGHQSLVEAAGMIHGVPIQTKKHDVQYGFFPVVFPLQQQAQESGLRHLTGSSEKVVIYTRSGYPQRTDGKPFSQVPHVRTVAVNGYPLEFRLGDTHLAPPGLLYEREDGEMIMQTYQFHPEFRFDDPENLRPMLLFFAQEIESVLETPVSADTLPNILHSKRDIADALFTPILLELSKRIQ